MSTNHAVCARLCAALFILLFCSTAFAGLAKVEVCHIPPGDPDNYHTIKISEKALAKHLAHFDLVGSCNSLCDDLCDDGNACTIDHDGDCESNGCAVTSEPVDCSDGNLCTDDLCDPASGCSNPVAVTCEAPVDKCLVGGDTCNPTTGTCEEPVAVSCNEGEQCNPDNGLCESDNTALCPCFDSGDLTELGDVGSCITDVASPGVVSIAYTNGNQACTGENCITDALSCGTANFATGVFETDESIDADQDTACRQLIVDTCELPSAP